MQLAAARQTSGGLPQVRRRYAVTYGIHTDQRRAPRYLITASAATALQWRKEPRVLAQGEVRLETANGTVLMGRLVDSSPHGLGITLKTGGIQLGEQVRLRYRWHDVLASIMWTREIAGNIEAGLALQEP